jgi:RimJ/RimL family protein N-acetyltransferase
VSNPKTILRTRRLIVREACQDDLCALELLNADPVVMRHVAEPFSRPKTQDWLDGILADYSAGGGVGWWVVDQADGDTCIGGVALKRLSEGNHAALGPLVAGADDDELMEIGWRFHERYWGRGYATETGRALVQRAFEAHGFPRVCAVALTTNTGSCRAIEKSGLRPSGDYDIGGKQARFFVLNRADYSVGGGA